VKVLFATGDPKINNNICDILASTSGEVEILEVDYLEDVENQVWELNPDLIIVSETVTTRAMMDKKGRFDAILYQQITALKDWDIVLLLKPDRNSQDPLIKRLLENEFYRFVPIHDLEKINAIPKNVEEAKSILGGDHQPHLHVRSRQEQGAFVTPPSALEPYLPTVQSYERTIDINKPIVSVFWSPLQNVGLGSFISVLGNQLAKAGRKVLLIELDWEFPKLARRTALTHQERTLKGALTRLMNGERNIEAFIVNNKLAEEDLPATHRLARQRLRSLPPTLFTLSRNAEIRYEDPLEIKDEKIIEKLFYDAKQLGFDHILVDVPSSPNELLTLLSLLAADEIFAMVDDAFTTSGIFKMAMMAFETIGLKAEDFQLIINKVNENITGSQIAEFYDLTPVLTLPYDGEMGEAQLDLKLEYGSAYMHQVKLFMKRYGVKTEDIEANTKRSWFLRNKA